MSSDCAFAGTTMTTGFPSIFVFSRWRCVIKAGDVVEHGSILYRSTRSDYCQLLITGRTRTASSAYQLADEDGERKLAASLASESSLGELDKCPGSTPAIGWVCLTAVGHVAFLNVPGSLTDLASGVVEQRLLLRG